jgi:hypothetical protein
MNVNKKNYHQVLSDISSDELFEGLLGFGLFAEKIPPFLTSEAFFNYCKLPTFSGFQSADTKYIHYESMRNINVPRVLAIPNPMSYYRQCKVLSDHWQNLLTHFKNQTNGHDYKISRIHIRKIDNTSKIFHLCYQELDDIDLHDYPELSVKHVFDMGHKNFCIDDYPEPTLLIGKRYIVKADISNCFPSIYTHSLPWALVTKSHSKGNRTDSEWFNQIDKETRSLKDGETHGILIGSHSSNLISEIILTVVDKEMYDKSYRYVRNIDDYTCYVESKEKAEKFLVDLSVSLKQFGLMLNHKKTEILKLPMASSENWVRKLNSFSFSVEKLKLSDVRSYLDIALELMFQNKENSAIVNYAIKVLSKKRMTLNAKDYFIKTIHHLVILYPYLVSLLDEKIFYSFSINKDYINKISLDVFDLGHNKKINEAMSYALYFSIKYGFFLHHDLYEKVAETNDSVLLLLAYLHDKKNSKSRDFNRSTIGKKYRDKAKELLVDIDEHWVFVYEVLTAGNLKGEWQTIKQANISFVKSDFGK